MKVYLSVEMKRYRVVESMRGNKHYEKQNKTIYTFNTYSSHGGRLREDSNSLMLLNFLCFLFILFFSLLFSSLSFSSFPSAFSQPHHLLLKY